MKLKDGEREGWRVVAFLQDPRSRQVLGAAQTRF
jgi:hypothetical protein